MTTITTPTSPVGGSGALSAPRSHLGGPLARLGRWTATHLRAVLAGWAVVLVVFGVFAPRVETKLAGAGWQDSTSQSVAARKVIDRQLAGLGSSALQVVVVDHRSAIASDPAAQQVVADVTARLRADRRVSTVVPPTPGMSLSPDGRTAVLTAGAAGDPNAMVRAAGALAKPLAALGRPGISVALTGDSALWANFNSANHSAMMRSELLSWPVTLVIVVIAFGSLVAAGLPLMLTMAGLLVAAGSLVLATAIAPVSIWALNFALMFALALGIDYALFIVIRFRAALARREVQPGDRAGSAAAVAETMDTAGKAVALSALTVLASLAAILLVPSPAFRSMALGIMLAVIAVLAATLTLLPAVLGRLGTRINAGRIRVRRRPAARHPVSWLEQRMHAWGGWLWRHPLPAAAGAIAVLLAAAAPVLGLRTSMPSITIIPPSANARIGYTQVTAAFGVPGTLQVLVPAGSQAAALATLAHTPGVVAAMPGPTSHGWTLDQVVPSTGPSTPTTGATIDRIRRVLPAGSLVGGAAAENHDLQHALSSRTPLVFGVLLALGFVLLLIAVGAPLLAAGGVLITGLSVAAAFGVARLIFQDGHLSGLLHFTPQGFVDAWGLCSSAPWCSASPWTTRCSSSRRPRRATRPIATPSTPWSARSARSGRVVISAAVIMIAVFLTFALSGPLAPKEMGVILAVSVAFDAVLVRLVLLPVLLRAGHHHAWHQPRWLARILPTVHFSH